MTKDEANRAIAEWLEPLLSFTADWKETPEHCGGYDPHGNVIFYSPKRAWFYTEREHLDFTPRDFYLSEEANALVLEKLLANHGIVTLSEFTDTTGKSGFSVNKSWSPAYAFASDRKTAIVNAALKLIEAEKASAFFAAAANEALPIIDSLKQRLRQAEDNLRVLRTPNTMLDTIEAEVEHDLYLKNDALEKRLEAAEGLLSRASGKLIEHHLFTVADEIAEYFAKDK